MCEETYDPMPPIEDYIFRPYWFIINKAKDGKRKYRIKVTDDEHKLSFKRVNSLFKMDMYEKRSEAKKVLDKLEKAYPHEIFTLSSTEFS